MTNSNKFWAFFWQYDGNEPDAMIPVRVHPLCIRAILVCDAKVTSLDLWENSGPLRVKGTYDETVHEVNRAIDAQRSAGMTNRSVAQGILGIDTNAAVDFEEKVRKIVREEVGAWLLRATQRPVSFEAEDGTGKPPPTPRPSSGRIS